MILTHGKVSKSVEYKIRLISKREIIKYVNNTKYEDIFQSVIKNNVQRDLRNILKVIHPMRTVLIRVLKEETHHASKISEEKPGKKSKKVPEKKVEKKEEFKKKKEEVKEEPKEKKNTKKETPKKKTKSKKSKK